LNVVLFNNIPDNFKAIRYHSLVAGAANNYVTAISHSDNEIMAFEDIKICFLAYSSIQNLF